MVRFAKQKQTNIQQCCRKTACSMRITAVQNQKGHSTTNAQLQFSVMCARACACVCMNERERECKMESARGGDGGWVVGLPCRVYEALLLFCDSGALMW